MNIVEPILFQTRLQPEAPALCAQGKEVVSYGQLVAQMNNVARRARSFGLKPANVVALSVDEPITHAIVILGLTQAGIIPLSVGRGRPPPSLKVTAHLSTSQPFAALASPHLPLDFTWLAGSGAPVEVTPAGTEASEEVCRICMTTGTSGTPRAVALTHRLAMARDTRFDYLCGNYFQSVSRVYLGVSLESSISYCRLTHILSRGGTIFFRGDTPGNTLRSFESFRVQAMVGTPASIAQLLKAFDQHPEFDYRFDMIYSTGSFLPKALLERVRPRLTAHVVSGYSSTEANVCASAPAHRIAHMPGAVGYVTPGARMEIVDESDSPVPTGTEGVVRIASEFAVDCYVDDPQETARVFRGGWFYPGDLGWLTRDKLLIISGRVNNILNAGGGKMSAERVEAVLAAFQGITEAATLVETSPQGIAEVWAAIVCKEKIDPERLRAHCGERMARPFVPAHVVTLDALPVNDHGKLDRPRLRQMVLGSR